MLRGGSGRTCDLRWGDEMNATKQDDTASNELGQPVFLPGDALERFETSFNANVESVAVLNSKSNFRAIIATT
jgi:hypothetical protein